MPTGNPFKAKSPREPSRLFQVSSIACDQRPAVDRRAQADAHHTRKKICFVSGNAYLVLTETSVSHIGGAEVQQAIIAKELRDAGYQVSFVTNVFDGRTEDEVVDGIKVFKAFDARRGVPARPSAIELCPRKARNSRRVISTLLCIALSLKSERK